MSLPKCELQARFNADTVKAELDQTDRVLKARFERRAQPPVDAGAFGSTVTGAPRMRHKPP